MAYFVLLLAALCLELALNLPVGSMPLALEQEGASRSQIAMAMGVGTVASLLASVPLGALVDSIGRIKTMRMGLALGFCTMIAMTYLPGPLWGGILMALRNLSLLAFMTAEFAYGSALVSKERSVSAVATMGIIGNFCFALAPALAVELWKHGVGREQYLWSIIAIIGGAALLFLLPEKHDFKNDSKKRRLPVMLRKSWLPPMSFALSASLQGGVNGTLAVLTFQDRGIYNGAMIFSASAITVVLLRYPAGRLVEKFGAKFVAVPTAIMQSIGCVLAANAHTEMTVIVAGICIGASWSAIVPVAIALLFDQSSHRTRGAAMGAYNLAFATGGALGAALATVTTLAGQGYALAISMCAIAPLSMLPFVLLSKPRKNGAANGSRNNAKQQSITITTKTAIENSSTLGR